MFASLLKVWICSTQNHG